MTVSDDRDDRTGSEAGNVLTLRAKDPRQELERLNRITGLYFDQMPDSLIGDEALQLAVEDGEELIHRAMFLWADS